MLNSIGFCFSALKCGLGLNKPETRRCSSSPKVRPPPAEPPPHAPPVPTSGPLDLPWVGAHRGRRGRNHRIHPFCCARLGRKVHCGTPSVPSNPPRFFALLGVQSVCRRTPPPPKVHHCSRTRSGHKLRCKASPIKHNPPRQSSSLFPCQIGAQNALQNITHKTHPPTLTTSLLFPCQVRAQIALQNVTHKTQPPQPIAGHHGPAGTSWEPGWSPAGQAG